MNEIIINWWAVLGAAVAAMVVGALWYGPLFGKKWKHLMGFTNESMKSMKMTPFQAMAIALVSAAVGAYILAHFIYVVGAFDKAGALQLAFWLWLGFVATTQLGAVLWEGKSWTLFFLNTACSLVTLAITACILARWA